MEEKTNPEDQTISKGVSQMGSKKSPKKIFYLILGIAAAIVLIPSGIYFAQNKKSALLTQQPTQTSTTPTQTIDETANWKTYIASNNIFTLKYPSSFYEINLKTYEGGATEKYIVDSKETADQLKGNNPGSKANLSSDRLLISPDIAVHAYELELTNPQGHSDEELLQKLVNAEFGTQRTSAVGENIPWVNLGNGKTFDGKNFVISTINFTKTKIDGHLAAKHINDNTVYYIILNGVNGSKSVGLFAQPNNSKYIETFDQILSTFKFTK